MAGGNGQECFVVGVARFLQLVLLRIEIGCFFIVRVFKQLLRIFAPCAEVLFIKDDQIPVVCVNKFVFRLDAAGFVRT